MTFRPALAALLAVVALLSAGCNSNQSGESVTDNQNRNAPPSASPS